MVRSESKRSPLQFYMNYVAGKIKLQRKSQAAVDGGHILKVLYDPDCFHIEETKQLSMGDTSYKVTVST